MYDYYTAAIYRRAEDYDYSTTVFDSQIVKAKNDLDAVKQVIAHSDADEVLIERY